MIYRIHVGGEPVCESNVEPHTVGIVEGALAAGANTILVKAVSDDE